MVFIALLLVITGALYVRLRWLRAPQAYPAMIALALGYFIAGALAVTWVLHWAAPRSAELVLTSPSAPVAAPASGLAAAYLPNRYTGKVVSVTDGDTIDVALEPNGILATDRTAGPPFPTEGNIPCA